MSETETVHNIVNIILNLRDRLDGGRFQDVRKDRLEEERQVAWARDKKTGAVKSSYYRIVTSVGELDDLVYKYLFQNDCTIIQKLKRVAVYQSDRDIISQL